MAKNKEENKDTLKNGQGSGQNGAKNDTFSQTDQQVIDEEAAELQELANEEENAQAAPGDEIDSLKKELEESKDKYIRLYSEFENYRRRTARERIDLVKTAGEEVLTALLPVVDDFERAIKSLGQQDVDASVKEGVDLIYNKLLKVLEQKGVKAMEVGKGSEFNPEFHEAVTQFLAPEESLKGKVVDVVEKGYLLGDKVVRFAKVVTGA